MAAHPLKAKPLHTRRLLSVYKKLRKRFGHQHWWPGETPFEVIVGAILTQNTSWTNVEKAIVNLKRAGKLTPQGIRDLPMNELAELLRPSGYFNMKAGRLKIFVNHLFERYGGKVERMRRRKGDELREELLAIKGIGPETADSILLYAFDKPFFVIDAYTRRIFSRHKILLPKKIKHWDAMTYSDWQTLFTENLPKKVPLYNDFHAQIVHLAKHHCRSSACHCESCPLSSFL